MASEGSREIEAAKLRLAAAKAQKASAAEALASADATHKSAQATLATAKKNRDIASSQVQTSDKEVKAAETFLKEAEKRWEVIDVDADEEAAPQDGGRGTKRRKVSLSPENGAGARRTGAANTNANAASAADASITSPSESALGETVLQAIRSGSKLVAVEGAGYRDFNGIYKQSGLNVYCKRRTPTGVGHVIFYRSGHWRIGVDMGDSVPYTTIYSISAGTAGVPPEKGWTGIIPAWNPAPKCRTNQITRTAGGACIPLKFTVGGCGVSEVNGIYMRVSTLSDGVPMYRKEGRWEGKDAKFLIWRQTLRGVKTWCISTNTTHFYQIAAGTDYPPMAGWEVLGKGLAPVPTLWITWVDELSRGISGISVKGSGMPEVNGMYRPWLLNGHPYLKDSVPVFRKVGRWEGSAVHFLLYRRVNTLNGRKKWVIRVADKPVLYKVDQDPTIVGPFENGWRIGNGTAPAPTVDVLM